MKDPNALSKIMINYQVVLTAAAFILFGAATHTAVQIKNARELKREYTWVDGAISFFIATFSGTMFGLLARWYVTEDILAIIISASAGGFLGFAGINTLLSTVLDVLMRRVKND